ncbi:MAG TPA: hypothetical protein G4O11_13440 [Anaerolineae bacterium]|nr:MAG: hypothetical protein AMJ88_16850 [Anaerolineae bacterium SM23_ 63]HEY44978.1 hypothetical protein [Anaerolineae bacterium]
MTSIRKAIQEWIFRLKGEESKTTDFSYAVYWTKLVSGWSAERRRIVRIAVERLVEEPDFRPSEYRRLYCLPEIDEVTHAGVSIQALLKVLEAINEAENLRRDE